VTGMTAADPDTAETAAAILQLLAGSTAEPLPRHKHGLSRDDVRKSQSARILAAAIDLFADQGYADTTVLQIAKRAGVSRKTFYEFYDCKEDVFLGTYKAVRVLVTEAGLAGDGALALESLPQYIERLLLVLGVAPAATRMFFLEALGAGPRVRARRNEAITEFVTAVAPRLRQLRERVEPTLPPLSTELCYAVTAAAMELVVGHLTRSTPETLSQLAPELTRVVTAIVTPNHPARAP